MLLRKLKNHPAVAGAVAVAGIKRRKEKATEKKQRTEAEKFH